MADTVQNIFLLLFPQTQGTISFFCYLHLQTSSLGILLGRLVCSIQVPVQNLGCPTVPISLTTELLHFQGFSYSLLLVFLVFNYTARAIHLHIH